MKKRVQAGWNGWRKVSGVMFDKCFSTNERTGVEDSGQIFVGLETVAAKKR